jgi:hypothetical protein
MTKQATKPVAVLNDPDVAAVSVAVAARILGIARSTASLNFHKTGEIVDGVPAFTSGRRLIVSTRHLRERLGIPHPAAS